jgi:excisionase family DNA binding protein
MMSIFEAAKYLGISVFSLRKLAREKRLPAGKVGRQWRFHKEDLDAFLRVQYGADDGKA